VGVVVPGAGPVAKSFAGSTLILVGEQRLKRRETITMPSVVPRKKGINRRTIVHGVTILTVRSGNPEKNEGVLTPK